MKAIFSVVISSAAMMRSPSFSRLVESSTTMNSPFRKAAIVSSMLSKLGFETPLTDMRPVQTRGENRRGRRSSGPREPVVSRLNRKPKSFRIKINLPCSDLCTKDSSDESLRGTSLKRYTQESRTRRCN